MEDRPPDELSADDEAMVVMTPDDDDGQQQQPPHHQGMGRVEEEDGDVSLEAFLGHLQSFERILRLLPTAAFVCGLDEAALERAAGWAEFVEGVAASLAPGLADDLDRRLKQGRADQARERGEAEDAWRRRRLERRRARRRERQR